MMVSSDATVSVYRRDQHAFVCAHDRTTSGLWIGSGSVERVDVGDALQLGAAVLTQLGRCTTGVRHPAQDEWPAQRRTALDPIIKLAGLRSWRSFIRTAALCHVDRSGSLVSVLPTQRDRRRVDVFNHQAKGIRELDDPTALALGEAIQAVFAGIDLERTT